MPKIILALGLQFIAFLLLLALVSFAPLWILPPYNAFWLVLVQASLAFAFSVMFRMNYWWWPIQFGLPWLWYWALSLQMNPWISLGLGVVLVAIFANAFTDRVPLYLTNTTTRKALALVVKKKLQRHRPVNFLDIGSGLGGNVFYMASLPMVGVSRGVETAPVPLFLSWLRAEWFRRFPPSKWSNIQTKTPSSQQALQANPPFAPIFPEIVAQDLWKHNLNEYDLVYAFLSTEPMPKLWEKVCDEMPAGSYFVSNSFMVPGVEPTEIWQLNDGRQTVLYLYQIDKPFDVSAQATLAPETLKSDSDQT